MSLFRPATSRPGNRGRLILRMLFDGGPAGSRPSAVLSDVMAPGDAAPNATAIDVDSPELGAKDHVRPSFAVRPLALPQQN